MSITHNAQRKILSLLLSLLITFPMLAEGLWGAKASLDINVPGKWKAGDVSTKLYTSGLGFSLGGVYSHYLSDSFFLEPSLSVFYDTCGCDFIVNEGMTQDYSPGEYKVGLRLPVVIGYTFDITDDFGLFVFTGPELNYAFAGGYRWKNKSIQNEVGDVPLFGNESGLERRLSCAWKGGLGFPFGDWRVDFEAVVGISDIIVGSPSMKENRFSLSLLRFF